MYIIVYIIKYLIFYVKYFVFYYIVSIIVVYGNFMKYFIEILNGTFVSYGHKDIPIIMFPQTRGHVPSDIPNP